MSYKTNAHVAWSDLSRYLVELRYGTTRKSSESGFTTLRILEIFRGIFDPDNLKTVAVLESKFEKLQLIGGDVLFIRVNGNPDYVGRCAVFGAEQFDQAGLTHDQIIYASYLIRARLELNCLQPVSLQTSLQTPAGRRKIREKCQTPAGQYNINTKGVASLQLSDILIDDQLEFESWIKALSPTLEGLTHAQIECDDLFHSLVQRAFKGEL